MTKFEQILQENPYIILDPDSLDIRDVESGVIFIYSSWSPTIAQFLALIESMKSFAKINFFVYDIDSAEFSRFSKRNSIVSHGVGETFWIKNGKIISTKSKFNLENKLELIQNHNKLF